MAKSNAPQQDTPQAPTEPAVAPDSAVEELPPEASADSQPAQPADVEPAPFAPANEIADEVLDLVHVFVPKDFQLRLDQHHCKNFVRGEQDMERQHALHWYAVANGVTVL